MSFIFPSLLLITAADADIGEGIDSMEKTMNGSLERGYNYLRDNFFGGDEGLYEAFKDIADIAFGIVSAKALANLSIVKFGKFACGDDKLKTAKAAVQVIMGVGSGAASQLIYTGKVDPRALAFNAGTGILQGYLGSSITNRILGAFGIQDSKLKTVRAAHRHGGGYVDGRILLFAV